MKFVIIDGKIVQLESVSANGVAKAITGTSVRTSTSNRSPGPGWFPVPNVTNRWSKSTPIVETINVFGMTVHESEGWPVGAEKYGFSSTVYESLMTPIVSQAVTSGGSTAKRVCPEISIEAFRRSFETARIPLLSDTELQVAVMAIWIRDHQKRKGSGKSFKAADLVRLAEAAEPESTEPEPA